MLIIAILAVFSLSAKAQKAGVLHYLPTLSRQQVEAYRGYSWIVVDHEVINNSAESLALMLRDNQDLVIFAYANKVEWHNPMFNDKPWSLKMVAELKKYPRWFMHDVSGNKLEFWPGTELMNCRLDCPRYVINGKSYNYIEFFTEHYIRNILGAYKRKGIKLSGMLDDELLKTISFIGHYGRNLNGVDSDGDGVADDPQELDRQWRLGNAYFLKAVRRAMGNDFVIIGNGGHGYYMDYCNGKQFEYFPDVYLNECDHATEAWPESMQNASGMEIASFNARTDNYGRKDNWFFTLCSSALLDNTLFSHGQNTPYDEKYNLHLGKPLEDCHIEGAYCVRKFQNGTVYVNPSAKTARVDR